MLKTDGELDQKHEEKIQHYVETLRYDYFQIMMKLEPYTSYPTNLIIEDLIKDLPYVETDLTFFISTKWAQRLTDEYEKDKTKIKFNTLESIVDNFKESARSIIYTDNGKNYNQIYEEFIEEAIEKGNSQSLKKIAKKIVAKEKLRINVALRAGKKIIKQNIWGFYGKDISEELILKEDETLIDPLIGGNSSEKSDNMLDEKFCIKQFLLFIKDSVEKIKSNDPNFYENIIFSNKKLTFKQDYKDKILSKINDHEIPEKVDIDKLPTPNGSEWYSVGMEKPEDGKEYENSKLKSALEKSEFTYVKFEENDFFTNLNINSLKQNSYVAVDTRYGKEYFKPVEPPNIELAFHYYTKLYDLFESLNGSCNNLIYILNKAIL